MSATDTYLALFKVAAASKAVQRAKEASSWGKAIGYTGLGLGLGGLGYLGARALMDRAQQNKAVGAEPTEAPAYPEEDFYGYDAEEEMLPLGFYPGVY